MFFEKGNGATHRNHKKAVTLLEQQYPGAEISRDGKRERMLVGGKRFHITYSTQKHLMLANTKDRGSDELPEHFQDVDGLIAIYEQRSGPLIAYLFTDLPRLWASRRRNSVTLPWEEARLLAEKPPVRLLAAEGRIA